jgi:hypothetical protein
MNTPLLDAVLRQLTLAAMVLPDPRPRAKVIDLGLALLCGAKPKTVTSALDWLQQDQQDWSDDYRLFSQTQWDPKRLLAPLFQQMVGPAVARAQTVYVGQDDTLLRKAGKRIPGTSWARDPLGPPFQVNLVWAQRFVQTSVLLQPQGDAHPWRAIPVQFTHAPTPKAPRQATAEELALFRQERKKRRLSLVALDQLAACRQQLDRLPGGDRCVLTALVDGGYANRTYFSGLPANTHGVARFRKDARLRAYLPAEQCHGARKYGADLPTPLEYLQDPGLPWQAATLFIAGQTRTLHYKEVSPVCWPGGTQTRPVRLLVIKAAGYRLRQGSKLLYRDPAFLITTDLTTPAAELLAAYIARWEVEVNFRDEKTLLGVGQAQVRNPDSVQRAPLFLVGCYAILLFCCLAVYGDRRTKDFAPLPKWRTQTPLRPSTRDLVVQLRKEAAQYPEQRQQINPLCRN